MGRNTVTVVVHTKIVALKGCRPGVVELCRGALSELPGAEWTLIEDASAPGLQEAELVVWDVQPGSPTPGLEGLPPSCKHVFVVHESRLDELCRRLPIAAAASILVEPSGPGEAREFFARLFDRYGSEGTDPRRGERDDLFQAFLLAGLKLSEFKKERGHFFGRALRDLAGPLTVVGGYCGLLLDQRLGPLTEAQLDVLRQMQNNVERLSSLLSSTLHLSRGMLEPTEVQLKPGDITLVLDGAMAVALPGAEAREIEIRLDVVQPYEVLRFDPRLIHEVLACLLNNACRFTPHGGTVEVRGYPVPFREPGGNMPTGSEAVEAERWNALDGYRIDIRDFGPPIPPECLPGVFELSGECSGSFDRSGGGLELAMCRMILDAHKGEMSVESSGSGTVFSAILSSHPAPAIVR